MTTVLDIVTRAARLAGITAHDEVPDTATAENGLIAYNDMIAGWELQGIYTGVADAAAADSFQLPRSFREGASFLLAERMSPTYMRPRTFDADQFKRQLQAAFAAVEPVTLDGVVPRQPLWR
jgi:hypothetical protein